jgi:hypothetical protein
MNSRDLQDHEPQPIPAPIANSACGGLQNVAWTY